MKMVQDLGTITKIVFLSVYFLRFQLLLSTNSTSKALKYLLSTSHAVPRKRESRLHLGWLRE